MCHLSVNFSDMFDQNPPVTIHKIRKTHYNKKLSHSLTFRVKVKVIQKSKANAQPKTCIPKKTGAGVPLVIGCDADADADEDANISKTICQPPPYGVST